MINTAIPSPGVDPRVAEREQQGPESTAQKTDTPYQSGDAATWEALGIVQSLENQLRAAVH